MRREISPSFGRTMASRYSPFDSCKYPFACCANAEPFWATEAGIATSEDMATSEERSLSAALFGQQDVFQGIDDIGSSTLRCDGIAGRNGFHQGRVVVDFLGGQGLIPQLGRHREL